MPLRPAAGGRCLGTALPILVLFAFGLPHPAQAGAIDRLHHFLETAKTLRADFTQTVTARNGQRPQESSGVMIFSRPGRFRWQIDTPYRQLLVGDGKQVWIYDPELQQVTVKKMNHALSSTPAALLAGEMDGESKESDKRTIEKNFTLHEAGERDGLEWVEARPKNPESGFERLQLGFAGNELKAMDLFDNFGQTTQLRFSNLTHNPPLAPSLLHFTPPEGADVIRE